MKASAIRSSAIRPASSLCGECQHCQSCTREPSIGDGIDVTKVAADLGQRQSGPIGDRAESDLLPAVLGGERESSIHNTLLNGFNICPSGRAHRFLRTTHNIR